jgi:hypothetical protein
MYHPKHFCSSKKLNHVCFGVGMPQVARNSAFRESWIRGHFGQGHLTGKACSEETHSLRNPVLGAQAPRKRKRNRTLAAKKMK